MTENINARIAILQLLILLHVIEEYVLGFSSWATRHFGTTTQAWYIVSHIFLSVPYITILLATFRGWKWGIFLAIALQALIFFNGLFHILTFIMTGEYSPGIISQIVIIPLTIIVYDLVMKHNLLTLKATVISSLLGLFGCALVVTSLLLDIPI